MIHMWITCQMHILRTILKLKVLVEEQQVDWRNWLFWKVEGWWWLGDSP